MRIHSLIVASALLLVAGVGYAAGTKEAKVTACRAARDSVFTASSGGSLGVCWAKTGAKPRLLRSYRQLSVTNPDTGAAEVLLVGFE